MITLLRIRKADPRLVFGMRGPVGDLVKLAEEGNLDMIVAVIGPAGPSFTATVYQAGEAIGGHRAIVIKADGKAWLVSPTDAEAGGVAGITTGAVAAGGLVPIASFGEVEETGWTWTPGPIWLGANGMLTQVVPVAGAVVCLGVSAGPTKMIVSPRLIARL
jgi:hypothetical protein